MRNIHLLGTPSSQHAPRDAANKSDGPSPPAASSISKWRDPRRRSLPNTGRLKSRRHSARHPREHLLMTCAR
eukprot:4058880-Pyramimonas_sp.AAC.1